VKETTNRMHNTVLLFAGNQFRLPVTLQICRIGPSFGPSAGLSLSKYFGTISGLHTNFWPRRTLLWTVTVEAIELINSSLKIIYCKLFSHVQFAKPRIPLNCAYLDSLGKFGFRA